MILPRTERYPTWKIRLFNTQINNISFIPSKGSDTNTVMHTNSHTYVHKLKHIYTNTYMHTHTYPCIHAHIYSCTHAHTYACMHAYIQTHKHTLMHTFIHKCIHAYELVYTHKRICMYACHIGEEGGWGLGKWQNGEEIWAWHSPVHAGSEFGTVFQGSSLDRLDPHSSAHHACWAGCCLQQWTRTHPASPVCWWRRTHAATPPLEVRRSSRGSWTRRPVRAWPSTLQSCWWHAPTTGVRALPRTAAGGRDKALKRCFARALRESNDSGHIDRWPLLRHWNTYLRTKMTHQTIDLCTFAWALALDLTQDT